MARRSNAVMNSGWLRRHIPPRVYRAIQDADTWSHHTKLPMPWLVRRFFCDLFDLSLGMSAGQITQENWRYYLRSLPRDPNPASRWKAH